MSGENEPKDPKDEGEASVPDAQDFLHPSAPPDFVEITDGSTGAHHVLSDQPPTSIGVPLDVLFEGVPPDQLVTYGTGAETEGLIMRPNPPEDQA